MHKAVDLRGDLGICETCSIVSACKNLKHVPFEIVGDDPQVLIVGDFPNFDDTDAGRPFMGRSGTFLREEMLKHVESYAIANIVQCHPSTGKTYTPSKTEYQHCAAHFRAFIDIIKPKSIILFGSPAAYYGGILPDNYLSDTTVTSLSKKTPIVVNDAIVGVNFHPSYVIRNGGEKSPNYTFFSSRIKRLCSGDISYKPGTLNYRLTTIDHLEDVLNEFRSSRTVALDYEGTSLISWETDFEVLGFSLSDPDHAVYVQTHRAPTDAEKHLLKQFLKEKAVWTYNCKYEMSVTWAWLGDFIRLNDVFVLCKLDSRPTSLKDNAQYYLQVDPWEESIGVIVSAFKAAKENLSKCRPWIQKSILIDPDPLVKVMTESVNYLPVFLEYVLEHGQEDFPKIQALAAKKVTTRASSKGKKKKAEEEEVPEEGQVETEDTETGKSKKSRLERVQLFIGGKALKKAVAAITTLKEIISDEEITYGLSQISDWKSVPASLMGEYCCYDSNYTARLAELLLDKHKHYYSIYLSQAWLACVMESYGTNWDDTKAKEVDIYYSETITQLMRELISTLDVADEIKADATTKTIDTGIFELFNPRSVKRDVQLPFWNSYLTEKTQGILVLNILYTELSLIPEITETEITEWLDFDTDVNKVIEHIISKSNGYLEEYKKTKDPVLYLKSQKILHPIRKVPEQLTYYTKSFASDMLEFNFSAWHRFGKMEIDNRSTWTTEFYQLFLLRKIKKVLKSKNTYIEGSVGRGNVFLSRISDCDSPPRRLLPYHEVDPEYTLSENEVWTLNTEFRDCFALTRRWRSPLHTIPQECELREIYTPRIPNGIMFHADYSQMEVRTMSTMANEESLITAFNEGKDIHRFIASKVFKIPEEEVNSWQRRFSKSCTFSLLYGKTEENFAADFMNGDLVATKALFNELYTQFPNIKPFMEKCHKMGLDEGKSMTMFGDALMLDTRNVPTKIMRDAVNWGIQGSASSVGGYSGYILYDECVNKRITAYPVCFTHDALDFEVDCKDLLTFIDMSVEILEKRVYRKFKIPAKIDWKIGINQYDTMELEELDRNDEYRTYKFKAIKKGFLPIIEKLRATKLYSIDILEVVEDSVYRSLQDIFAPKTAYSKYIGETENLVKGTLRIYNKE